MVQGVESETHLIKNIPLPIIGRHLYLKNCIFLLCRSILPHRRIDLGKTSLANHITNSEKVFVELEPRAWLDERERGATLEVAGILTGLGTNLLKQLEMCGGPVRLARHALRTKSLGKVFRGIRA